jgi:hypothetical protein
MRPIADLIRRATQGPGAVADITHQDIMFRALSHVLGVSDQAVFGETHPETGDPSTITTVQREAHTVTRWIENLAWSRVAPEMRAEIETAVEDITAYINSGVLTTGSPVASIVELSNSPEVSPEHTPDVSPGVSLPGMASQRSRRTGPNGSIHTGATPSTASVGGSVRSPEDTEAQEERRSAIVRALLSVWHNEAQGAATQFAGSAANSLMRNVLSVMLPTMLRQYLAQGLATGIGRMGHRPQLSLALIAALIPPVLLGIGWRVNHDNSTLASDVSRAFLVLASLGAVAAAAATSDLRGAAPALISYLIYAAMRDGVQMFLRLDNPNAEPQLRVGTSIRGAAGYTGNQMGYGMVMSRFESPSGTSAAGMGLQAARGAERGATNMTAETSDDLFYNWLASRQAGRPLRLTLSAGVPSLGQAASTYTTTNPARAALGIINTLLSDAVAAGLSHTSLGAVPQETLNNLFGAAVLGMLYPAFLHIHQGRLDGNGSTRSDVESVLPQIRISRDEEGPAYAMTRLSLGQSAPNPPVPSVLAPPAFTGNVSLGTTRPSSIAPSTQHSRAPSGSLTTGAYTGNVSLDADGSRYSSQPPQSQNSRAQSVNAATIPLPPSDNASAASERTASSSRRSRKNNDNDGAGRS